MKRIFLTLFFIASSLFAQVYQSQSNSTATALLANRTFTGTKEKITNFNNAYPYNYVVVVVKSDSSGTGKIQQSLDGVTWNTSIPFTYTAPDTVTNRYIAPIVLPYIRVTYTNGNKLQTRFRMTTTFINSSYAAITGITIGDIGNITGTVSLPTGASTATNQSTQITRADSLALLVKLFGGRLQYQSAISTKLTHGFDSLKSLVGLLSLSSKQTGNTGGGYNKVTSAGGDSLAATETSWWRVTIRAVDDTVAFSKTRTYPSTDLNILYPGQSYTYNIPLDVVSVPKIYFKAYLSGTPTVQLKHDGR
jgi:hypothetical protein